MSEDDRPLVGSRNPPRLDGRVQARLPRGMTGTYVPSDAGRNPMLSPGPTRKAA